MPRTNSTEKDQLSYRTANTKPKTTLNRDQVLKVRQLVDSGQSFKLRLRTIIESYLLDTFEGFPGILQSIWEDLFQITRILDTLRRDVSVGMLMSISRVEVVT